jgi:UDP-N-acetylmuramyl tripeptide synthase
LLAKNPASFNFNLEAVVDGSILDDTFLFVLNDNIPDGRDVSWIYDIDAALLSKACAGKTIFVSGTRALDMALRLNYAGVTVPALNIAAELKKSLACIAAGSADLPVKSLVVFPNYSAMLETRKLLVGRKIL